MRGKVEEGLYLGRKLTKAGPNMGKIAFHTGIRVLLAGVVIVAGVRGNPVQGKPVSVLAGFLAALFVLGAALWVFFPLFHCRDYLVFYERGIDIKGRKWTLEKLGEISFMEAKYSYSLFGRTYLCTEVQNFDVTYIKDGKKNFNRAYYDVI